jgi:hypothetical protein
MVGELMLTIAGFLLALIDYAELAPRLERATERLFGHLRPAYVWCFRYLSKRNVWLSAVFSGLMPGVLGGALGANWVIHLNHTNLDLTYMSDAKFWGMFLTLFAQFFVLTACLMGLAGISLLATPALLTYALHLIFRLLSYPRKGFVATCGLLLAAIDVVRTYF